MRKKSRRFSRRIPGLTCGLELAGLPRIIFLPVRRPKGSLGFWLIALALSVAAGAYELATSRLESRLLAFYSGKLTYAVNAGPSSSIVFPTDGPLDIRRGYTRIPEFETRLAKEGFSVSRQATFSRDLAKLARWGIAPPYREAAGAGLLIKGVDGKALYRATAGDRRFGSYENIPPLLVAVLLYVENRELGDTSRGAQDNPVVDWPRLAKAAASYAGWKMGLPVRVQGGSTLATQIEKFQHSPAGRTGSGVEKLRQMLAASFSVYREGLDTRRARQNIILDYLNTVPLAAVPGYGEVNGFGNGLYAWFGLDLNDFCSRLNDPDSSLARAQALKYALALVAAIQAPSYYLTNHRDQLDSRVRYYTNSLAQAGIIQPALARSMESVAIRFSRRAHSDTASFSTQPKAAEEARTQLAGLLGINNLYDLDGLHLEAKSTRDTDLQEEVLRIFVRLKDPKYAGAKGLYGKYLFSPGDDLNRLVYSFLLYESTPRGNELRADVDSLDTPLDINEGVQLQLGSTAKLRVLAHYLELMAGLHGEFSLLNGDALAQKARQARDPLTAWAAGTLEDNPGLNLDGFLTRSLDRMYSASPNEAFFTGGGAHNFRNFDAEDNNRILSIRVAMQHSVNLVFIRLMRDIVLYHEARLPYDPVAVLHDPANPARHTMLEEIAAEEARERLARFYRTYHGLTLPAALANLLGSHAGDDRQLTMLFFAWHPEARASETAACLAQWLESRHTAATPDRVARLVKAYGNPRLTISDYGYLLAKHPLEIWAAGQMALDPAISLTDLLARSTDACRIASAWLFQTRNRAAQDLRLRSRFEQDAFKRMTPYWQRLGFPFESLVPSLATAIGSSADQPAALAELMGIIQNDGALRSNVRFAELRCADGTPYETVFTRNASENQQVMAEPVARLLRQVLAEVVDKGTAIGEAQAFSRTAARFTAFGGKTGSGDNRFVVEGRGGVKLSSRAVNRTATFVFYLGDRYFGVLTAFVDGPAAANYRFTSSLSLSILKILAPVLEPHLFPADPNARAATQGRSSAAPKTRWPVPMKTISDMHVQSRTDLMRQPEL